MLRMFRKKKETWRVSLFRLGQFGKKLGKPGKTGFLGFTGFYLVCAWK